MPQRYYHIGSKGPDVCHAKSPETCPFNHAPHYTDFRSAVIGYEDGVHREQPVDYFQKRDPNLLLDVKNPVVMERLKRIWLEEYPYNDRIFDLEWYKDLLFGNRKTYLTTGGFFEHCEPEIRPEFYEVEEEYEKLPLHQDPKYLWRAGYLWWHEVIEQKNNRISRFWNKPNGRCEILPAIKKYETLYDKNKKVDLADFDIDGIAEDFNTIMDDPKLFFTYINNSKSIDLQHFPIFQEIVESHRLRGERLWKPEDRDIYDRFSDKIQFSRPLKQ